MANVQITELATTKTRATIDADAEYLPAEPVAGTSYKMLITEAVAAGLAQATAGIDVADDVDVDGNVTCDVITANAGGLTGTTCGTFGNATVGQVFLRRLGSAEAIRGEEFDNGTGTGNLCYMKRNTNGSTPAPGALLLQRSSTALSYIWPDDSGVIRTSSTAPNNANMAGGTVVGTQTSMAAAKNIMPGLSAIDDVAARIQAGADAVRKFAYKSGAYNRQMFEGVVVDEAPEYGMDRDNDHPAGKSLNEIQIIGDLLRMVADLAQRVAELEAK